MVDLTHANPRRVENPGSSAPQVDRPWQHLIFTDKAMAATDFDHANQQGRATVASYSVRHCHANAHSWVGAHVARQRSGKHIMPPCNASLWFLIDQGTDVIALDCVCDTTRLTDRRFLQAFNKHHVDDAVYDPGVRII